MAEKNKMEKIRTDLQMEEHLETQETGFVVQKFGLAFMTLLVLLAAVGVFGDGIASKSILTRSNTEIEFDRLYRFEARMDLKISMSDQGAPEAIVSFPNAYLTKFRIESIVPEPARNSVKDEWTHFHFDRSGPMELTFYLIPQNFGSIEGPIRVGNETFPVHHFIYP